MNIAIPFAAAPQAQIPSAGFNANFTEVATKFNTYALQTDVAKVVTVTHIWNASQTFAAGLLLQGNLLFTEANNPDIGQNGANRPRDLWLSRDLSIQGMASLGPSPGAVASSFDRAIIQGTSAVANDLTIGGPAASQVRLQFSKPGAPGQGSVAYNMAVDQMSLIVAGSVTTTVSSAGLWTFPAAVSINGTLNLLASASKIKPGATSLSLRNNADTADNLLIADGGNVTARTAFITAGGTLSNGSPFVASMNLVPVASDPSSPANGDIWVTTAGLLKARLASATKTIMVQQPSSGYVAMTGTANRGTVYDTGTITLVQLATRVKAIEDDLMNQNILSV